MTIGDNPCGNVAWWVWLILALFIGALIALIVFVIGKYHRKHQSVNAKITSPGYDRGYTQLHPTIEIR